MMGHSTADWRETPVRSLMDDRKMLRPQTRGRSSPGIGFRQTTSSPDSGALRGTLPV